MKNGNLLDLFNVIYFFNFQACGYINSMAITQKPKHHRLHFGDGGLVNKTHTSNVIETKAQNRWH